MLDARMVEDADYEASVHPDRPLTRDEIATLVPSRPTWIMIDAGAPCATTYGKAFAEMVTDGVYNESFQVELLGCPAPADRKETFEVAAITEDAPTRCTVAFDVPISSHTVWGKPATERIPAELAAVLGPACQAPCTRLWSISGASLDDTPMAWEAQVTDLTVGDPDDECSWPADNATNIYVNVAGTPRELSTLTPKQPDGGRGETSMHVIEHLFAVVADGPVLRALIVKNLGEYAVYEVSGDRAKVVRHVRWYYPHEEDYASDGVLGPYCGP
jgi:hypothetical protein